MDLNRLTQKSQEALHDAQTKALRFGHTEVDGEHLLLAWRHGCWRGPGPTRTASARRWRRTWAAGPGSPDRGRHQAR